MLAKFFDGGWADYRLKDWSNASYKRGYTSESGHGRGGQHRRRTAMLAKFFDEVWGWVEYRPKALLAHFIGDVRESRTS
jgi:hypothetical protein